MFSVTLAGRYVLAGWLLFSSCAWIPSAGANCTNFAAGVSLGRVSFSALTEASGIAASRRNYTVLWTHNDGSEGKVYALTTNAVRLATFDLGQTVEDVEDIAVGPGPTNGISYLYVGDIGGSARNDDLRHDLKLFRIPEPAVELAWASSPRALNFADVSMFTLIYPDGDYNAETLLVDPLTADVFIVTKEPGTRLYRANVNSATNRQTITLQFVRTVVFDIPSGGDISPDGTQIILRHEDAAKLWECLEGESIGTAIARAGQAVPLIGTSTEPNGEALGFLADSTGYVTISEGSNPRIYFFGATCQRAPQFMIMPTNQTVWTGGAVQFRAGAVGNPAPAYEWRRNGEVIPGQTRDTLIISNASPASVGEYEVMASNAVGSATASATLDLQARPDLRITEVMSSEASTAGVSKGDWWELTSFEADDVNLQGWRFNDNTGGLTDPFRITNALVIAPGESIIFAEGLSAAQFVAWWGSNNLPANLKVVTYTGSGYTFGTSGDGIRLWDNLTTNTNDSVARVDFGAATASVSFTFNPLTQQFGALSQLGLHGAFKAAAANDVGSPGRVRTPVVAPSLSGVLSNALFRVEFATIPAARYSLESREDFAEATWSRTGDTLLATNAAINSFTKPLETANRFYRVVAE